MLTLRLVACGALAIGALGCATTTAGTTTATATPTSTTSAAPAPGPSPLAAGGAAPAANLDILEARSESVGQPSEREMLRRDAVMSVVQHHAAEIRACHAERGPAASGMVTLQLTIDKVGAVAKSAIASSTMNDKPVEACIAHAAEGWTFADGIGPSIVSQRFLLRAVK